jgi:hypothetical protein
MTTLTLLMFALAANPPVHALPPSSSGDLVVGLCDGQTSAEVKGVKAGETLSRPRAQEVSDELMAAWRKKHPDAKWEVAQAGPRSPSQLPPNPAPTEAVPSRDSASSGAFGAANKPNLQTGQTYGAFSDRDAAIWAASTQDFVNYGKRVFHDAKELGGTVGISCDMCHPDAANTHPETYPKFQVQLGKVALLRDMINWCIENPVKGKPLRDDDVKLKAMEAYILAQRKGVPIEIGKH